MKILQRARRGAFAMGLCGLLLASAAHAQDKPSPAPNEAGWELTISPYAYHFNRDEEHRDVYLVGIERHLGNNWLWGAAYFSNSFGQESGTAYVGYVWNELFGVPALYGKLVAGIMYGYVAPYEDKVPFNHNGWSPLVVPALGWRVTPKDALQVSLLGTAGIMFSYNRRF